MARVVVTGVGVVTGAVTGGREQVRAFLASSGAPALRIPGSALLGLVDEGEARRLSRVCQLSVAAARIALADAGLGPDPCPGLGLVIGAEFGDLRSTIEFVNGYLCRGPGGLSALLFPNTVMNTMAATTAIAVAARGLSLTLNAPTVAGERAIAGALDEAGAAPGDLGRVWISASGDGPRDRWEQALLEASLRPARPPQTALGSRVGRHSGLGALAVAASVLDSSSRGPALVHAIARGGSHVAMVVRSHAAPLSGHPQ